MSNKTTAIDYAAWVAGIFVFLVLLIGLLWRMPEDNRQTGDNVSEPVVRVGQQYTTKVGTFASSSREDLREAERLGDMRAVVDRMNTAFTWRARRSVTVRQVEGGIGSPTNVLVVDDVTGSMYWTYPTSLE